MHSSHRAAGEQTKAPVLRTPSDKSNPSGHWIAEGWKIVVKR